MSRLGTNGDADMLFSWNDNLETGIATIDRDHKAIIHLINETAAVAASGRHPFAATERLQKLVGLFQRHFLKEQGVMAVAGYLGYAEHRNEHDEFLAAFQTMIEQSAGGRLRIDGSICYALKFIIGHRSGADAKLADFMELRGPCVWPAGRPLPMAVRASSCRI